VTRLAGDRFVRTRTMRTPASLVTAGTHANPANGSRTNLAAVQLTTRLRASGGFLAK
ncbi:MAG: hypothetical protein RLZ81_2848, partial [Pseudomonadota bacterium]|jgi:hypothetical protein